MSEISRAVCCLFEISCQQDTHTRFQERTVYGYMGSVVWLSHNAVWIRAGKTSERVLAPFMNTIHQAVVVCNI